MRMEVVGWVGVRWLFVFRAEDGIRDLVRARGVGDGYKRQGHARALITIEDPKIQLDIYHQTINEGLSVRKVEELVRMANEPQIDNPSKPKETKGKANLGEQEIVLKDHLTNRLGPVSYTHLTLPKISPV